MVPVEVEVVRRRRKKKKILFFIIINWNSLRNTIIIIPVQPIFPIAIFE